MLEARGHHGKVTADAMFFGGPEELRAWLEEHHATESEMWIGYYKKGSGKRSLTWSQVIDEVLCFGWIDGKTQRIDEHRYRRGCHHAGRTASGARSTSPSSRSCGPSSYMTAAVTTGTAKRHAARTQHAIFLKVAEQREEFGL